MTTETNKLPKNKIKLVIKCGSAYMPTKMYPPKKKTNKTRPKLTMMLSLLTPPEITSLIRSIKRM